MHAILSLIIVLIALFDMVLGFGFLINPVSSGSQFGLSANGAAGLSALRADFTAFFLIAGGFMLWGAWKRRGYTLVAPLGLFLVAFTGRLIGLLTDGPYAGWAVPMAVEMGHVVLLGLAIRAWPWRGVASAP